MRIDEISIKDLPPVKKFDTAGLADIVVIAGPNGVGKTRLLQGMVNAFQSLDFRNIRLRINATCQPERESWGKDSLDTGIAGDVQLLSRTLQQSRRRSSWQSSVLQFESDRSIQQIQPFTWDWNFADPFQDLVGWSTTFGGLRSRWQDTLHSLFRKARSHRESIARRAEQLKKDGEATMPLDWEDPLKGFKIAFSQLLAPKRLLDPDLQRQELEYELEGQKFPISTLSSGEREVVNIVFDVLLRNPQDCVVLFDEPELHLHPELSYRLLQTLRAPGNRNQFIFCTHSPDIITASLDQSVVFVAPPKDPPENQAIVVRQDDETNQALQLLGQSIGIITLGRRLVLIEGKAASLDKQTYGMILRNRFPELVLVPSGGKGLITSFDRLRQDVLERTIWGVRFFMLCDGDAIPSSSDSKRIESQSGGRLRLLPRYHLENYFLDEEILAAIFARMEPVDSWIRDPKKVGARLVAIATEHASYAAALMIAAEIRSRVGNVDMMPGGVEAQGVDSLVALFEERARKEETRINGPLTSSVLESMVRQTYARVQESLESSDQAWKRVIPGRPIFNKFAQEARLGPARLKQMFIAEVESSNLEAFDEVVAILESFGSL